MPDQENDRIPEDGSETSPSSPPPSAPPTGADFRFQSGPFTGLTASEAAQKYDQDLGQVQHQTRQYQQQVSQYLAQMQQPAASQSDPDLWLTDAQKAESNLEARLQRQWNQQAAAVAQPIYQGQASLAKSGSQNDPRYKDVWTKYGREVESLMANVPASNAINKEVWDQAAKLIRSNHIDEIAAEKAQNYMKNMANTETGQRTSASLPQAQVSAIQKIRESDYGKSHLDYLSDAALIKQAGKMGNTINEYADMVASTHVISHPKKPGEWVNQGLVRNVKGK